MSSRSKPEVYREKVALNPLETLNWPFSLNLEAKFRKSNTSIIFHYSDNAHQCHFRSDRSFDDDILLDKVQRALLSFSTQISLENTHLRQKRNHYDQEFFR